MAIRISQMPFSKNSFKVREIRERFSGRYPFDLFNRTGRRKFRMGGCEYMDMKPFSLAIVETISLILHSTFTFKDIFCILLKKRYGNYN